MTLRLITAACAVCAAARGITEAPAAITTAPDRGVAAPCSLTNSVPACGVGCLLSAAGAAGCANVFDLTCQCSSATFIRARASPCVLSSCGSQVGSSLESVASAICSQCVQKSM